jgi:serine/threonine-protein kinase
MLGASSCGWGTEGAVTGARRVDEPPGNPLIGTRIGGKYVFRELLGAGGMGVVYRAEQPVLERSVAIKLLRADGCRSEEAVSRFYTEARAASRLNHPNSVSVLDFGVTDDAVPYLVMEYVPGIEVGTLLQREPFMPLPRVCHIVEAVLAALGEAHELGVVHRDLKPENILVTSRSDGERVKVVDFGLARLLQATVGDAPRRWTMPGFTMGTPAYMSPEQIAGDDVDGRSDLYAVGVILFEMLCGRQPFIDASVRRLRIKHLKDPPPDPCTVAPPGRVPPAIGRVVLRALEKDPDDRYATAYDMGIALRDARRLSSSPPRRYEIARSHDSSPMVPHVCPVEALDRTARHVLAAAMVLGTSASVEALDALVPGARRALDVLSRRRMVGIRRGTVILDESVRERVAALTRPAVVRRLHDGALAWHADHGSCLAIRAAHAVHGSDPLIALVLLEQVGRAAAAASDAGAATVAFRCGFDLARAELARTRENTYRLAVTAFGSALAMALERTGDRLEAETVLESALEACDTPRGRARLLTHLGRLQVRSGRVAQGLAVLERALILLTGPGAHR